MMRLFIRFLLLFCFLLLGRYAPAHQNHIGFNSEEQVERLPQADIAYRLNEVHLFYKSATPGKEKLYEKIRAVEIEDDNDNDDDETESFKKNVRIGNEQGLENSYRYCNSRLIFCKHIEWSTPDKFIFHQVFRI
jgi:hypothetical protein